MVVLAGPASRCSAQALARLPAELAGELVLRGWSLAEAAAGAWPPGRGSPGVVALVFAASGVPARPLGVADALAEIGFGKEWLTCFLEHLARQACPNGGLVVDPICRRADTILGAMRAGCKVMAVWPAPVPCS